MDKKTVIAELISVANILEQKKQYDDVDALVKIAQSMVEEDWEDEARKHSGILGVKADGSPDDGFNPERDKLNPQREELAEALGAEISPEEAEAILQMLSDRDFSTLTDAEKSLYEEAQAVLQDEEAASFEDMLRNQGLTIN